MVGEVGALFASVVSQMSVDTLRHLIEQKTQLVDKPFIKEILGTVDVDPAALDGVTTFWTYQQMMAVDPAKAQVLMETPGGFDWLESNIQGVRRFYQDVKNAQPQPLGEVEAPT